MRIFSLTINGRLKNVCIGHKSSLYMSRYFQLHDQTQHHSTTYAIKSENGSHICMKSNLGIIPNFKVHESMSRVHNVPKPLINIEIFKTFAKF